MARAVSFKTIKANLLEFAAVVTRLSEMYRFFNKIKSEYGLFFGKINISILQLFLIAEHVLKISPSISKGYIIIINSSINISMIFEKRLRAISLQII